MAALTLKKMRIPLSVLIVAWGSTRKVGIRDVSALFYKENSPKQLSNALMLAFFILAHATIKTLDRVFVCFKVSAATIRTFLHGNTIFVFHASQNLSFSNFPFAGTKLAFHLLVLDFLFSFDFQCPSAWFDA